MIQGLESRGESESLSLKDSAAVSPSYRVYYVSSFVAILVTFCKFETLFTKRHSFEDPNDLNEVKPCFHSVALSFLQSMHFHTASISAFRVEIKTLEAYALRESTNLHEISHSSSNLIISKHL